MFPYTVADGARNMALDEAMLAHAVAGRTLLRFYGWDPWCLSLGRNQSAPERLLGRSRDELRPGVDAVRRPTGGRSVFHGPEITYALACPDRAWGGPKSMLRTIHRALADGLRSLGIPVDDVHEVAVDEASAAGSAQAAGLSSAGCFRDPAPSEVTVDGRKLVGSAQCRRQGGLLQHGSILLEDRQALGDLDAPGAASERGPASPAIGLRETLDPAPDHGTIVARLATGLSSAFGAPAPAGAAAEAEAVLARLTPDYEALHRSAAWLWLRSA
ncbi:lipoate--protein ligase family protein [Candidatus Palauibacter sp.]|uniref:lipoate--protein ligase family protein n=1 Tax=Candidatus Palauibacter sp. TaxID=3101350 RepID=UPI003AF2BE80